eukprot:276563-Prymnesium_polylepis.1
MSEHRGDRGSRSARRRERRPKSKSQPPAPALHAPRHGARSTDHAAPDPEPRPLTSVAALAIGCGIDYNFAIPTYPGACRVTLRGDM